MKRFFAALKLDFRVQVRNQLYTIGIGIAALVAGMLAWLGSPGRLMEIIPPLLLIMVGGTTFLYVGALIFFEKEQGTLPATIVSPIRASEYLWAKIISLTGLATLESVLIAGGGMLIMNFFEPVRLPNLPLLLAGILLLGMLYALLGIIVMVRYDKFTDFLIPMAVLISLLQLPFLYFWGVIAHPLFLIVPTSAPAMLMRGAFVPLTAWEWLYGFAYSAALIAALTVWAYRAFDRYIIQKAR